MLRCVLTILSILILSFHPLLADAHSIIVEPPSIPGNNSFAIIIDSTTFVNLGESILQYRKAIENDRLPTYIIIANWQRPEQIRDIISEYYKQKWHQLEGFVLVGDIPIVMLKDAQHLTSAFRIDQDQHPDPDISVPTDRYYDDLDLRCEFLYQDSSHANHFYYRLLPASPVAVRKDLYSARISLPNGTASRYARLKYLFKKIIRIKTSPAERLDNLVSAYGFNYISNSYAAIVDEHLAIYQALEFDNSTKYTLETIFHRVHPNPKQRILHRLAMPGLDLFILHSHGNEKTQFIQKNHGQEICNDTLTCSDDELIRQKNIDSAITSGDLESVKIAAPVVVLDVCYNGAFQKDSSLAVDYLYTKGSTVALLANTVNVRQDINFVEHIGALNYGVRLGKWHQLDPHIESHLFGDPTFHFAAPVSEKPKHDLPFELSNRNREITKDCESVFLRSQSPYQRASALDALFTAKSDRRDSFIKKALEDPAHIVRLKAWLLLASERSPEFVKKLPSALEDPYELIRRYGAIWMGETGSTAYITHLVRAVAEDPSERVVFNALIAIKLIGGQEAINAFKWILTRINDLDDGQFLQQARANLFAVYSWMPGDVLPQITQGTSENKIQCIKLFRGNHHIMALPALIFALGNDPDAQVQAAAAEALGWYSFYERRTLLIEALDKKLNQPGTAESVVDALSLARRRLLSGSNKSNTP